MSFPSSRGNLMQLGMTLLQPARGAGSHVSLTPDGTLVLTSLRSQSITSAPKPSPPSPPIS